MCDLLLTSRPFRFKKFEKSSKNGRESDGSVAIAGTGKKFSLSAEESSQPGGTRGLQVRILSGTVFFLFTNLIKYPHFVRRTLSTLGIQKDN